jgi:hypothetical protein
MRVIDELRPGRESINSETRLQPAIFHMLEPLITSFESDPVRENIVKSNAYRRHAHNRGI